MNKVILIGRVANDIEIKYSKSDNPIAILKFILAVNRKYSKNKEQESDFINCVAFGKTSEFISKYFEKGKKMGIVGNISTSNWMDKDGYKKYKTEVLIEEVEFVESKNSKKENIIDEEKLYNEYYEE